MSWWQPTANVKPGPRRRRYGATWPPYANRPPLRQPAPFRRVQDIREVGQAWTTGQSPNLIPPLPEAPRRTVQASQASLTAPTLQPTTERTVEGSELPWMIIPALWSAYESHKARKSAEGALGQQGAISNLGYEQLKSYYLPLLSQISEFLTQWNDPRYRRTLMGQAEEAAYPLREQALGRIGTEFTRRGEGGSSMEAQARGNVIAQWANQLAGQRRQLELGAPEEFMNRAQWLLDAVRGIYQPLQGLGAQYRQQAGAYAGQQTQALNALLQAINAWINQSQPAAGYTPGVREAPPGTWGMFPPEG